MNLTLLVIFNILLFLARGFVWSFELPVLYIGSASIPIYKIVISEIMFLAFFINVFSANRFYRKSFTIIMSLCIVQFILPIYNDIFPSVSFKGFLIASSLFMIIFQSILFKNTVRVIYSSVFNMKTFIIVFFTLEALFFISVLGLDILSSGIAILVVRALFLLVSRFVFHRNWI